MSRQSLEQLIEAAAEKLPEGWTVAIEVQKGYGEVMVTRPDGTGVGMSDGEMTISEQFAFASIFIRDEIQADEISQNEKGQP